MSESNDVDVLLTEATKALDSSKYSQAEVLQRKAVDQLRQHEVGDARLARELEKLAGIHFVQQKFQLATNEYQEVLKLHEERPPEDACVVLRVLYWLGKSQFKQQNYEMAETNFRRALSLAESLIDNSGDLAFSLYQLGFLLYYVGRYQEAESYLLRALPLYERTNGLADAQTIEVLFLKCFPSL